MLRESLVAKTLVELADNLVEDFDVVELLTLLTDRCVEVLDVSTAGLMLATPDAGLRVMASSSETMRLIELFEVQSMEGPCHDSYKSGKAIVNQELAKTSDLWPGFTSRAIDAGFQTVHALPMRSRGTVVGALNLFRVDNALLSEADVIVGQALADVATIAILQHRAGTHAAEVNQQLNFALTSRIVIEQAKGIVAEQANLNMEEAFNRLRNHARNHNLRLADVGVKIVNRALTADSLDRSPIAAADS